MIFLTYQKQIFKYKNLSKGKYHRLAINIRHNQFYKQRMILYHKSISYHKILKQNKIMIKIFIKIKLICNLNMITICQMKIYSKHRKALNNIKYQ